MRRAGFLIAVLVVFAAMTITVALRAFTGGGDEQAMKRAQATMDSCATTCINNSLKQFGKVRAEIETALGQLK